MVHGQNSQDLLCWQVQVHLDIKVQYLRGRAVCVQWDGGSVYIYRCTPGVEVQGEQSQAWPQLCTWCSM